MKTILLTLFLSFFLINSSAQITDSLVFDSEDIRVVKDLKSNKFEFLNKKTNQHYKGLKFAKLITNYFQVLDENNKVFYLGLKGDKKEQVKDFIQLCKTAPYYKMTITQRGAYFKIIEDEVFFDWENKIPAREKLKISKAEADSVLFVNGKTNFEYSSMIIYDIVTIDPTDLILIKNGKYFAKDHPGLKFDSIDFSDHQHSLKTKKNNLYGILGVVAPKYLKIEKFKYYLAKAITKDGKTVYIDLKGNEY